MDWKNCRRLFQEYEKKLSPYKEFSEVEYRLSAAEAIHKYIKKDITFDNLKKDLEGILDKLHKQTYFYELFKLLYQHIIKFLENANFYNLLFCLQEQFPNLDQEKEAILQNILTFFQKEGISDEERRKFFHSLWLMIHREATKDFLSAP